MAKTEHLVPFMFKKGQSGNPNGQPRKANRIADLMRNLYGYDGAVRGITKAEADATDAAVLSMDEAGLKQLAASREAPAYARTLAIAIITDMQNGRTTTIDRLHERRFGKPPVRQEIAVGGATFAEFLMGGQATDIEDAEEVYE